MAIKEGRIPKAKVRTLIKAYLVFNKGKKIKAKEIADWINRNHFALAKHDVNSAQISRYIGAGRQSGQLYSDVHREKINGLNHFWVE